MRQGKRRNRPPRMLVADAMPANPRFAVFACGKGRIGAGGMPSKPHCHRGPGLIRCPEIHRKFGERSMSDTVKYVLDEKEMPRSWYNLAADLPKPLPPVLHPGTMQPIGPADLAPLFPMEVIKQEVSTEREIDIPEPVRDDLPPVAAVAALPRSTSGAGARYAGAHLLQVRRRFALGQPQAEHRRSAGLLQQAGRRQDASRPRPVRGSGARRSPSPARCSASRSTSTWSRSAISRSRTGGR